MIAVVDYGVGNVRAFLNAYRRLNIDARQACSAVDLEGATKVILPGVGAFDHAMERLVASGMRSTLDDLVLHRRVPVLGVCVGMQILARESEEGGSAGLGWIDGRVRALRAQTAGTDLPLPHMGWNDVALVRDDPLFRQIESGARFYFLHSFHLECASRADVTAVCRYGEEFSAAVSAGNVYGVQFHPEKSHDAGTRLLRNFAEL